MASPGGGGGGDGDGDGDDSYDGRLFEGVRFVLVGFEDTVGSQYRSDMVRRGGVDVGRLGNGCTHVIVWGLLYDDQDCVVARAQGKKVVSELWVDDSLDRGVLADADRALYWPVREFNGIPGAESLVICLTGFQKEYREDITKMVSLMGAKFSKPLVGNVVTHLICYKFEGDKYELARKVHIKLANHRWLEDCLKMWKILPVDDYNKSTWELELIEAHVKDSEDEDETEDTGQRSLKCGSRIMCTPNFQKGAETSVNSDGEARMQSPIIPIGNTEFLVERHLNTPGHVRETEDAKINLHTSRIKSGPDSAKADVSAPTETPCILTIRRKNDAVRNMNSPNPIQESGVKYVGARTLDATGDDIATPNLFVNKLDLSKADRVQHQEKDSLSGNLVAAVVRSNEKTKTNIGGDFMSKNIDNQSNFKRASQKLLAPKGYSDHPTVSHHKTEESTLRAHSNNSSLEMAQEKIVEHADIQGIESNENNTNIDAAYAQQGKNLNSQASLKLQKEGLVSETSPLHCPFVSRQSDASETVNISSVGTNPVEDFAVDWEKQQSSLGTSRQSRSRKKSLKHAGSVNEGKLAKYSSCGKNVKSLSKSRSLPKAVEKNKSSTSSSATGQDGNTSSCFSFDNMDVKNVEASASAVSQNLSKREMGSVHGKDQARDISEHGSKSSEVVLCSGIADTKVAALHGNDNEVAAVMMVVSSDANVREGTKGLGDSSSNAQAEISHSKSKKVAIPTKRIAGSKRPQSACMEIDGPAVNTSKKLVSESHPAEVIPRKHAQGETSHSKSKNVEIPTERIASAERVQSAYIENDVSVVKTGKKLVPESGPAEVIPHNQDDAASAEFKADSPTKVPISTVRNTVTRRTRNALTKMDDARAAPNLEEISQENKLNPSRVSDIANGSEGKNNGPKKLPNTIVRNTSAKKSQKSITNISEALVSKTETMAAGSLFDDLFPEDNVKDFPKMLSSSASASDCGSLPAKNVLDPRARNGVPKRKMKDVKHKIESKRGKVGSAIASVAKAVSSKRIKEMSCNFNKVSAEQNFEKDNKDEMRDVSGLFCKDSATVDKSEGVHNSKVRSSKCNKVLTSNNEKENMQDHSNLDSESNARTDTLYSKCDAKSMRKDVLGKHQGVKGNETKTLILSEPALFILSGNRQQRASFRSILRRLKGRVCRDSHHWSYQATHFIATEPLRRTEKFFAAAAAGRWILKSDYLTSSIEAGKFLDEEPFEWFGTGLSDGEKISLEAPRKWRILRQQMRHGAFYGMQIVVYGQLILPTLDTVKRAVQAGDGTILATSPPYTRFLDSGVDFAVVSGSIPRDDEWVQEFIQHGIPCVSADYLVEYVCKAGHPLDSHVLFETNDLADRSLEKLMKNQQELATDEAEQSEDEDLSCSVCGRKDRGDVMLICGDEDDTVGCGIGTHIDCCNPPLDVVPDDDWLCNNCNVPKTKTKPARSTGRKLRPSKEM